MVSIGRSTLVNNSAFVSGGAVYAMATAALAVNSSSCGTEPVYRKWSDHAPLNVSGSTFDGNRALCATCSGGALAIAGGIALLLDNSSIVNNLAGFAGGGLSLGMSSSLDSCTAVISGGSVISGNVAVSRSSGQISDNCGGDIRISDSTVNMSNTGLEVTLQVPACVA